MTDFLLKSYQKSGKIRYRTTLTEEYKHNNAFMSHLLLYISNMWNMIIVSCVCRYGGISVGGVNSQVKMNESEITAAITDLKSVFNVSQVRPPEAEHFFLYWSELDE